LVVHLFYVQNPEERIQPTTFWDKQMRAATCSVWQFNFLMAEDSLSPPE